MDNWQLNNNASPALHLRIGDQELEVKAQPAEIDPNQPAPYTVPADHGGFNLFTPRGVFHCAEVKPDLGLQDNHSEGNLTAPMNGTVVTLLAEKDKPVSKGETLLVMEAMKMEHAIIAPADGTVAEFFFSEGDLVDGGAELLAFYASEEA